MTTQLEGDQMLGALTFHPKVAASALAGALVVIVVYSLQQWAGVTLPDAVSAALTVIFTSVAGWLAPSPAAPAPTK